MAAVFGFWALLLVLRLSNLETSQCDLVVAVAAFGFQ